MDLASAGLRQQPFRTHGKPISTVLYSSFVEALGILRDTCRQPTGLALVQGPALSGKTTMVREFVDNIGDECAAAVVDGDGLNTTGLLEAMLLQFGYELNSNSANELLGMLRVFALQQASSHESPILIVENTHALNPSALRALCELANLKVRQKSALKMVLVSDRPLESIIEAPAMASISKRVSANFHFQPMSSGETRDYLFAKLRAAGAEIPELLFPEELCAALWKATGGWPGIVERVALLALSKAETVPVPESALEQPSLPRSTWDEQKLADAEEALGEPLLPPQLHLTLGGDTLQTLTFDGSRLLIGRSEHNDVSISSKFISRHQVLLVRHSGATFLMDLNSTNGTFVNSQRVSNYILAHNDVITIGHHRLKFVDPQANQRMTLAGAGFAETTVMKTVDDMRRQLARENTQLLPAHSENLPTAGNDSQ